MTAVTTFCKNRFAREGEGERERERERERDGRTEGERDVCLLYFLSLESFGAMP